MFGYSRISVKRALTASMTLGNRSRFSADASGTSLNFSKQ